MKRGTRTCEYPERIPLAASQPQAMSRNVYLPISRNTVVLQSARKEVSSYFRSAGLA